MKYLLTLITVIISLHATSQENENYNFGFEEKNQENVLSDGWSKWGKGIYDISIDSIAYTGTKAGKIDSKGSSSSYGSIAYKLPANYVGKTITLEGFMKIRNVEQGFAGLLLRIDGSSNTLAFDNMQNQKIIGTRDWQKYSITLDYPEAAEYIIMAGILVGKGEAWFDDFALTIDGEQVQTLKKVKKKLSKPQMDKEFDNGSNIEIGQLTPKKISDLELLGRVWGFLKYHHPKIAQGNYNWDYELFRFLPNYIKNESKEHRDNLILEWIDSLGILEKCSNCKPTNTKAYIKPDLKWINNQEGYLKEKLLSIYANRSQGKNYYIQMVSNVGNPEFTHEKGYPDMPYPDDGFRLLSLYRYWNMIYYFFPYKYLADKDWNHVLNEYLPLFLNADNELEYEQAVLQIIAEVHDTHAKLWGNADKIDQWKGKFYAPIHVRFIEDKLTVVDYYNEKFKSVVGLKKGDVITQVNGKTIKEIIDEKSKYYPASNQTARLLDISADILRANATELAIQYISKNSQVQSKTLKLYPKDSLNIYRWYRKSDKKSFKILDDNIGYITLQTIKKEDIPAIKNEMQDTRGIIIDIRNYPSTFVPFSLGSYFVSSTTPFAKFTKGNIDNPGEFTFTETENIDSDGKTYKGKLVVLVNEFSMSQAEYTAMAFRAGDNTTIIGGTTAGADGNVSAIVLPGGLHTRISGIGVYYPNGDETQRVGIIPDIKVEPSINAIKQNKDEVLIKAIETIMIE